MVKLLSIVSSLLILSGCVSLPDVYLVDRHTVMESEASGEWPILEKRFLDNALSAGAVPLKTDGKAKESQAYLLLNSELSTGTVE